jgi:hypothetical protein
MLDCLRRRAKDFGLVRSHAGKDFLRMQMATRTFALFAITTVASVAVANEIFDSPGPGYRQQIELFSPAIDRADSFDIQIQPAWLSVGLTRSAADDLDIRFAEPLNLVNPPLPDSAPDLPQPIRLFISPQQLPTSLSLPDSAQDFSQPIRLFISPQQLPTGFSIRTPTRAPAEKFPLLNPRRVRLPRS